MSDRASPDFSRNVHCLLGVPFDAIDMDELSRRVHAAAESRTPCMLTTANVNFLVSSRQDESLRHSIIDSDLVVADGMPIVWIAGILGVPVRWRLAGSSLFERLRDAPAEPLSVFFFGGASGIAERASFQLNSEARGLRCVGFLSPGFGPIEEMGSEATIREINATGADFLIVALGTRKGQAWIETNRSRLTIPVVSYLGAVINFAAGMLRRAPVWVQRAGFEWLWRIKEEPALWRRYAQDGLVLLRLVLTRVVPLRMHQLRHRPSAEDLRRARVESRSEDGSCTLRLHGAWCDRNLDPVRAAFAAAAARNEDVTLDLAQVSHVDSAFLGLVLLLSGAQRRCRRSLTVTSARPVVRRTFHYCLVDRLLAAEAGRSAGRAIGLAPAASPDVEVIRR
jgi:N-acetylglucosaminyldiphosphoundecaprenol N-acetyl-beta-D-mannosaminyltransferase